MKSKWIYAAPMAIAAASFCASVQATPISGSITFAGGVQLDTSSAGTATKVTQWTGAGGSGSPIVITDSGSFSSIAPNTAAAFTAPFLFNSGAIADLWSVGGFTFDLISSHIFSQGGSPAGVIVDGTGTISGNGFTPTTMSWSFSVSDPAANSVFSFQAASGALSNVPEGGLTVLLLGGGLLALGLLKKHGNSWTFSNMA